MLAGFTLQYHTLMPSRNGEDASDTVSFGSPDQQTELTSQVSISGKSDASKARVTRSSARLRGANRVDIDSTPVQKGEALDSGKHRLTPKQSKQPAVLSVDPDNLDESVNTGGINSNSSRFSSRQTRQSTASQEKGGKKKPSARKRAKAGIEGESPNSSHVQNNVNNEIDDGSVADQDEDIGAPVNEDTDSVLDNSPSVNSNRASSIRSEHIERYNDQAQNIFGEHVVGNGTEQANDLNLNSQGNICSQTSDPALSASPCDSSSNTQVCDIIFQLEVIFITQNHVLVFRAVRKIQFQPRCLLLKVKLKILYHNQAYDKAQQLFKTKGLMGMKFSELYRSRSKSPEVCSLFF